MCHQSDLGCISILHVALNEEHLHELRLHTWFFPNSLPLTLPILNFCDFLFVHYKRHCCTELVSWEHTACPLSGIKKRLLMGG